MVVTLTASENPGFSFSHWSGDLGGSVNPEMLVMDDDKSVSAHFVEECYTLDVAVVGHSDFLRRVCFLLSEQSETWSSGYGTPADFTYAMKKGFTADPADGLTVFIGHQSTSEIEAVDAEFDKLRDKLVNVINASSPADFSTVYLLELD
jgi:hypothetical protein